MAAFPASMLENKSTIETPVLSAYACSIPITSPKSAPDDIISVKDIPAYFVPFAAFSSASAPLVPCLLSSANADFSCVVA